MLAAIGHDLRTPLTSLRVRVETLPDGPQRDKIIKKTEEMAAMLEAILAFAKAHADDYAIDLKKIDIAALLEDLCNDYKAAAKNVTSEIAGKIEINADMLNLRRALSNIIDNGLFYGTAVKLSLLTQQNNVIITIDDNGPGVDTGLLKDLVRPFFRSDTSRNNQSGGIGMGLALTKTVIERHRGTLDFRNTQSGFQVLVVLPLAAS
jgi:signal transduction histidine kinase